MKCSPDGTAGISSSSYSGCVCDIVVHLYLMVKYTLSYFLTISEERDDENKRDKQKQENIVLFVINKVSCFHANKLFLSAQ